MKRRLKAKRRLAGYAALVYKNASNCQDNDAVPDGRLAGYLPRA